MWDSSVVVQTIRDLLAQNKTYEAYQQFESGQFRSLRKFGLKDTLPLFYEAFEIFSQLSDKKYQIEIVKMLWSHVTTNMDHASFTLVIKTEIQILNMVNTYEPNEEWDQLLHQIIGKINPIDERLSCSFRIATFHFYLKFGELAKALKHCIYLENGEEIGDFLANYAIEKLPKNEWDLLITNYILQILQLKNPSKANAAYNEYIKNVKESLGLGNSPPYGPILLNYSKLLIDAAIENKPSVMDTIQKTYLPTIKRRDEGIAALFDMMFSQCYPNMVSQNRTSSNVLLNLANQFLNSTPSTNSTARNHDFGLD